MYRRFIKDSAKIARLLNGNLRKYEKLDCLDTTPETLDAFNMLEFKSVEPPVLVLLKPHRLYMT